MTDAISFPPLLDLSTAELQVGKQHLLSEIARGREKTLRPVVPPLARGRRLAWAAAVLVLVFAGVAYATGFNPFKGISAANHPATANDSLPAWLAADIAQFNSTYEQTGHGQLLPDSARLIRQLPSGMRFYTLATSAGDLCLANVYPPVSSNARGGFSCGDSLSQTTPITVGSEEPAGPATAISYGLAMDGVTAVSFMAGGGETTVPVTDNVWIYAGQANLQTVTVHWADGSTQALTNGR